MECIAQNNANNSHLIKIEDVISCKPYQIIPNWPPSNDLCNGLMKKLEVYS